MNTLKSDSNNNLIGKDIHEQDKWNRISRVETIGELMVKMHDIKLSQLIELVEQWKQNPDMPLGQIAVERGLISKESLFKYLDMQAKINKVVDKSLHDLGQMTNEEKWSRLIEHDNSLGDILIKKKILKLSQLYKISEQQKINPDKSIEELLIENSLVTQRDIDEALEFYNKLEKETNIVAKQIKNFSR